jgi:predicted nucleic acid-binding protein
MICLDTNAVIDILNNASYDLLIAAQARRRGALLVTANTRECARVPGLDIEDWAKPD